ncbi:MAG: acyltransferase [Acidimicrobiales bacterium]
MSGRPAVPTRFDLRHVPALDGLRGVAVAGVLLFHGGALTGGYLGVDLFFVLSGFLITSLLLREFGGSGTIRLSSFWARRARRLLPALFGLVAVVALYCVFVAKPYELGAIRADALASVFYVANWRSILGGSGYWDLYSAPSPFHHTWSLAIEEQFYLVWPLVVLGLLKLGKGRRGPVLVTALVGALASATLMALLWVPDADTSRVYLGTDTRAAAVLLGAALATMLAMRGPIATHRGRVGLEWAAVLSAVGLGVAWATTSGLAPWLYHYGFFVCGVASTVVIAAITHPRIGPVGRVLQVAPLRWLGLISYGLYLWHWPVYVVLNRERVGVDGIALLAVRLAVSLAFAVVSYFVLELPIRRDGLAAWRRPVLQPVAAVLAVVAVLAVTAGATERTDLTAVGSGPDATLAPVATFSPAPGDLATAPPTTVDPTADPRAEADQPVARPTGRPARLMLVGDSVPLRLGESLDKLSGELGLVVANRALPACSLGDGPHRYRYEGYRVDQEKPVCRQAFAMWADDVPAFRPDAVVLTYGGPPQGDREVDGAFYDLCDPVHLSWYRQQVDRSIDILSSTGAVVFLATSAYSRFPWMPRDYDRRTDCINEVYRQAAAARPASVARVLPLGEWACPPATKPECVGRIDGVDLREDGVHYEHAGADLASRWIAAHVFTPPT